MSYAKKCDMCGTCFNPLEAEGLVMSMANPFLQNAKDARKNAVTRYLVEDISMDERVDLCPECTRTVLSLFTTQGKKYL